MATTVFIKLNPDNWIEVSIGTSTGHLSNITDTTVSYREGGSLPDASDERGHHLRPDEVLQYTLGVAGSIYMRSVREKSTIACTPGQTFFGCCEEQEPPPSTINNYLFQGSDNYIFQDGNNFGFN